MKLNKIAYVVALASTLVLSACKKEAPGEYDAQEVGKIKKVVPGVVVSMRPVRFHNKAAEMGITSHGSVDPSTVDASSVTGSRGFEYVIKLNSGSIISIVQAEQNKLKPKQHILVIYGKNTRVVADKGSENF